MRPTQGRLNQRHAVGGIPKSSDQDTSPHPLSKYHPALLKEENNNYNYY